MLKKIAIAAAAAAVVGGVGLSTAAQAHPWPRPVGNTYTTWDNDVRHNSYSSDSRDEQDNFQIVPIQLCNIDIDVIAELIPIANAYDNGSDCVNGSVQSITKDD
ncbi:hypothetical protein [Bailinhaonella thermotolerans]|uniref:Uncharacterized protein n=1 Tax=Bailinhaonella thermotolerans TaxID=1070861 RepID=A0A3A4A1M9_9ACTN|nr:hypothetical protein [Bailinhaonella thermotolerans]RJL22088.1 hypothetical protein D5H75_36460 [Bailinhaonella thermotolerans]